ncbi:hypothetical protein [Peribacillus acanthi]|uniref:hypothetical protein n=1 Tax=Peribacillus acanthi TaxID=2171554 RepID=UPI000D3E6C9B|nr:hypothetical protein [Peribacillus acanthi]
MEFVYLFNADRIIVRKKKKESKTLLKNTFYDALQYIRHNTSHNFETTSLKNLTHSQYEIAKVIDFTNIYEQRETYAPNRLENVLPYFMFEKQSKVTFFVPSMDSQQPVSRTKRKKPQDSQSCKKLPSLQS